MDRIVLLRRDDHQWQLNFRITKTVFLEIYEELLEHNPKTSLLKFPLYVANGMVIPIWTFPMFISTIYQTALGKEPITLS